MLKKDFKLAKKENFNVGGKIHVRVLVAVTTVVTFLIFAQLVFANNLAVDGQKLSQVEEEIKNLQAENTALKVEIAKASSFTTLSQQANDLGFMKPSKVTVF